MKFVRAIGFIFLFWGVLGLLIWLLRLPGQEQVIGAFSTSLKNRNLSQIHNVELALRALDGKIILPGSDFSFNMAVGPWTADKGYRRAPVSFSGDLVRDWGGGVCQVSTTLYNAALLAGLPILERSRHHWPATYVPPGQDAAVAYPNIDLSFRNCLNAPIRISARLQGDLAVVQLYSRQKPPAVHLEREVLARVAPLTVVRTRPSGLRRGPIRGQPGYEIAVYRVFEAADKTAEAGRRELVSRDNYPPKNRIVWR